MTRFPTLKWLVPVAVALLVLPAVLFVLGGTPAGTLLAPSGDADDIHGAFGPDGKAHLAYTDDYDPANDVDTGVTKVMYVREV